MCLDDTTADITPFFLERIITSEQDGLRECKQLAPDQMDVATTYHYETPAAQTNKLRFHITVSPRHLAPFQYSLVRNWTSHNLHTTCNLQRWSPGVTTGSHHRKDMELGMRDHGKRNRPVLIFGGKMSGHLHLSVFGVATGIGVRDDGRNESLFNSS